MGNLMSSAAFVKEHEMDFGPVSRPGCWAYPDMLQVGNNRKCGPSVPKEFCPQITVVESYTHFAAWCITSAPLILGFDLTNSTAYDEVYPIVTNALALKINQEWAGQPGGLAECSGENFTTHDVTTTVTSFPYWQIWHKPLKAIQNKVTAAVLVINLSDGPRNVTLTYAAVESLLGDIVTGIDVWTGESIELGVKSTVFSLDPHASRFLVLKNAAADTAADDDAAYDTAADASPVGKAPSKLCDLPWFTKCDTFTFQAQCASADTPGCCHWCGSETSGKCHHWYRPCF